MALSAILLATAIVHWPAFANGFLDFDDPAQVLQNDSIRALDAHHLARMFSQPVLGMYSPLATLSYAVDYRLGGLNVWQYHATNLFLHLLSVTAVFFLAIRLTSSLISATLVAALFGVHPIQVASVAPIMQRNGLLYCCLYLAGYLTYLAYIRSQRTRLLVATFILFAASLLSKSPAVVFPILMVLTDWYFGRSWSMRVVIEKAPFFAASIAIGFVALMTRPDMAAMKGSIIDYSILERAFMASYSILFYLVKLLVPVGLSGLHPYPPRASDASLTVATYLSPLALMLVVLAGAWLKSMRRLVAFAGAFFILHLALLIKIVPFGVEFTAERYLYLPAIAVFLLIAELVRPMALRARGVGALCGIVLLTGLSIRAHARNADFSDSLTFYQKALEVYPRSAVLHNNYGSALAAAGQEDAALQEYRTAAICEAGYVQPHVNLGNMMVNRGRPAEALREFAEALRLDPSNAKAHAGIGHAYSLLGRPSEAIDHLKASVQLDPSVVDVRNNLGVVLDSIGRTSEAIVQYNAALTIDPDWAEARNNLGVALANTGHLDDARAQFSEAVRINPSFADARRNLGLALLEQGLVDEAIHEFEQAARLSPNSATVHFDLAKALVRKRDVAAAIRELEFVLQLLPNDASARALLAQIRKQ